jgi:hypothetical protein
MLSVYGWNILGGSIMSWRPCALLSVSVLLLAVASASSGATLTVGSGKSNYATIQSAVDRAVTGDVVVISRGTYSGTGNCDVDLKGKAITIQGSTPEDPNTVAATIVDCRGTSTTLHRGFVVSGCTGARIAGLTITNGVAASGGAIYCLNSVLDVANCRILNNSTIAGDGKVTLNGGNGGGIYAENSSLQVVDSLIQGNTTSSGGQSQTGNSGNGGDGAGIYATGTLVEIQGCTFSGNRTGDGTDSKSMAGRGGDGGGVCADSLKVQDSNFVGNATGHGGVGSQGGRGGNGGAILCSRAVVTHTVIQGNVARSGGTSSGSGKVTASFGGAGGGLYCAGGLEMTDCLVVGNGSGCAGLLGALAVPAYDGTGAGIWCMAGQINRCTIVSNDALRSVSHGSATMGAGLFCTPDTVVSTSILWSNTPDQLAGCDANNVTFCDIESGAGTGAGNLAVNPAFVSPGAWAASGEVVVQVGWTDRSTTWRSGDYRLSGTSPCIDTGNPTYTADANAVDLAGLPRVSGGRVDIGAYELQSLVPVHHFQSPTTSKHFYTAKEGEKNKLISKYPNDWSYKGIAYYAYAVAVDSRLKPVYRLWSDDIASHFWTSSESERAKLLSGTSGSWTDEGIAFYVFTADQRPAATKPVYRFWSTTIKGHYYTIDEAEKNRLSAKGSGWTFEDAVWYAYDTPATANEPVVSRTYSFMADVNAVTYQMTLKAVIDGQEVRLDHATAQFTPALGSMVASVDLDALTFDLTSLFVESEFLQYSATATQTNGHTTTSHTLGLSVYGFFNSGTPRGPYAVDARTLSFPTASVAAQSGLSEDFVIAGAVNIDGAKADVSASLEATSLTMQGTAVLNTAAYPSNVGMTMNGPFRWIRQGHEDLLADVTVKDHRIQLYVTSLTMQTTGVWAGKLMDTVTKTTK